MGQDNPLMVSLIIPLKVSLSNHPTLTAGRALHRRKAPVNYQFAAGNEG